MNKKQWESDYTSAAAIFQSLLITVQRTLFHFAYGLTYMLPLATGSMNRIGPYISYCVRALLRICRYICDLWEDCFVLGQHNEEYSCKTFEEPAWRQQRMCYSGGEEGAEALWVMLPNFHRSAVASLQWPKAEELQQQWKKKTNHTKSASEKMHVWNWRRKFPAKLITRLFIWILIAVVGLSFLAQPYALKVVH